MASVTVKDIRKTYGDLEVIHGLNLEIPDGAFVVLLGPSGCGKSTLLRMIAGLEPITHGEISIGGQVVNDLHPKDRNIAMVFQNYALYAHMKVFENMAFSMRLKKTPQAEIEKKVNWAAEILNLVPYLNLHKVVEYDKDFNVVWTFGTNDVPAGMKFSPWAALRLKNGNTLITSESGNAQIEVNPDKKIVWLLKNEELPEPYQLRPAPQSVTRLANGNTILASRGGSGKGPQLVEVTPDKKVVWVLQDWKDLGPATAVQILDDPGVPEIPGESEH